MSRERLHLLRRPSRPHPCRLRQAQDDRRPRRHALSSSWASHEHSTMVHPMQSLSLQPTDGHNTSHARRLAIGGVFAGSSAGFPSHSHSTTCSHTHSQGHCVGVDKVGAASMRAP
ncbi:hypothetical protein K439DRAFT_570639 [Ramaria rubella]|nr:hypothetical protein K439DRAFT_570639 [Ramaria rubella]